MLKQLNIEASALLGGLHAWENAGYPVNKGAQP